ncbi:hypothetical protein [Methylopila sp. M107]|uniref:hypothetical protein n=1 Tax=Methylopila sp. M107 TaxID=1101190 RepID=UPI00036C78D0|nr:hypothetical protein [Methylopila sp. M107]
MALFKGSRYEKVTPFQPDDTGRPPFRGLRPREIGDPEAVLEHVVSQKERLDGLGQNFYARSAEWYRVAEANFSWLFPEDILHFTGPAISEDATPAEAQAIVEAFEKDNGAERVGASILIARREDRRP